MKYLILVYFDEKAGAKVPKEEIEAAMVNFNAWSDAMEKAGMLAATEVLHPTSSATTVRRQNGKTITTHGPFAETQEQLGSFYLIEAQDLDEAIDWASRCPATEWGSVEVRPVMEFAK
jgi:hypothetical protein